MRGSFLRGPLGPQSSYSSRWDGQNLPRRFLDSISNGGGSMSTLTCRYGRRVSGGSRSNTDRGCSHERSRSRDVMLHGRGRVTPHKARLPRVPNRRTILWTPSSHVLRAIGARHVYADMTVAADSPRLHLWRRTRTRCSPCGRVGNPTQRDEKCLPECPAIDGSRRSAIPQRAYSCAKRCKNLYSTSYSHILDQMVSLPRPPRYGCVARRSAPA